MYESDLRDRLHAQRLHRALLKTGWFGEPGDGFAGEPCPRPKGLCGVLGGSGDVGPAGGGVPDQDAWFGLLEPPPLGLLTAMVVAAQRAVVTHTSDPPRLARGGLQ